MLAPQRNRARRNQHNLCTCRAQAGNIGCQIAHPASARLASSGINNQRRADFDHHSYPQSRRGRAPRALVLCRSATCRCPLLGAGSSSLAAAFRHGSLAKQVQLEQLEQLKMMLLIFQCLCCRYVDLNAQSTCCKILALVSCIRMRQLRALGL